MPRRTRLWRDNDDAAFCRWPRRKTAGRCESYLATIRWRRERRLTVLRRFADGAVGMRCSSRLLRLVLEELGVGEDFRILMGSIDDLLPRHYAQALAVALALRYSYRKDLLRNFERRLKRRHRG
jgi:hypothetical protein